MRFLIGMRVPLNTGIIGDRFILKLANVKLNLLTSAVVSTSILAFSKASTRLHAIVLL